MPSKSRSTALSMWPPLTTTARAPRSTSLRAAASMPARSLISIPESNDGFRNIWRDHRSALHQFVGEIFHSGRHPASRSAGGRLHDRIEHDVRKVALSRNSATTTALARLPSIPIFTAAICKILRERIELRAQGRRRRDVIGLDALRGLHRERGDRCDAVTIVRRKSFQIGGDSRAAGRIESRNRQNDG